MGFDKLELSTETIRELSADEMQEVAGGAIRDFNTVVCLTGIYPTFDGCFQTVTCQGS